MRSTKGYYYEVRDVCPCCGSDTACSNEFLEPHAVSWASPDVDYEFFDLGTEKLVGDIPNEYTRYWEEIETVK